MSLEPYWADDIEEPAAALFVGACACGCGGYPAPGRKFINRHNLRVLERTDEYRKRIGEGQKRAWLTTERRKPLGSKRMDAKGYILVKTRHGQHRWEKEHVLVMQEAIGRALVPGEQVHHLNGIKTNNRIENLLLCENSSDHMSVEATFSRLLPELMTAGVVVFDHTERRYGLA